MYASVFFRSDYEFTYAYGVIQQVYEYFLTLCNVNVFRTKPETEKKVYVIPLIKQNKWRKDDQEKLGDLGKGKDAVEDEAIKEILQGNLTRLTRLLCLYI